MNKILIFSYNNTKNIKNIKVIVLLIQKLDFFNKKLYYKNKEMSNRKNNFIS